MGAISIGLPRGNGTVPLDGGSHQKLSSYLVCLLSHCYEVSTNSPHDCATICRGCEIRRKQGIRVCRGRTLTRALSLLESDRGMSSEYIALAGDRILVTGSNGFIGAKVVESLLEYGFSNLRCFVRPASGLERLHRVLKTFPEGKRVEFVCGDLSLRDDCKAATRGISVIIHLAASFAKSFSAAF